MSKDATGGAWGSWLVRRGYERSGYLDAGERAAFASVGDNALRGARILDLAVGAGRTTAFLAPVAGTYLGVDLSPGMVAAARRLHPGVAFAEGDLGDLSGFADESWDVVDISFNSIDVLPHEAQPAALADLRRMLVPGGHLVLSMLNLKDGVAAPASAGDVVAALRSASPRRPHVAAKRALDAALGYRNYRRLAPQVVEGTDWAWRPIDAHQRRFLAHFVRFGAAVQAFRDAGFEVVGAWSVDGEALDLTIERHDHNYTHFHCRRPAAG